MSMQPKYLLESGEIYYGKCEEVIPALVYHKRVKVDLVILDPPYFETETVENWKPPDAYRLGSLMNIILKKEGVFCIFGYQPYMAEMHPIFKSLGFEFMCEIIWGKGDRPSMGDGRYPLKAHVNIWAYRRATVPVSKTCFSVKRAAVNPEGKEYGRVKPPPAGSRLKGEMKPYLRLRDKAVHIRHKPASSKLHGEIKPAASRLKYDGTKELIYLKDVGYPRSLQNVGNVKENSPEYIGHATQVPLKLMEVLVRMGCPEGGRVLDPYFGSGSSGVVCTKLKRKFIGIEIDAEWVEKSYKRIADVSAVTHKPIEEW